jgi:hypothetical protein
MKSAGLRCFGVLGILVVSSVFAAGAPAAMGALVLKSGGQVAPVGTSVSGVLSFRPCGEFESQGTLSSNSRRVDVARFSSTEGGPGGCAEGGPLINGSLRAFRLTEAGRFIVVAELTYETTNNGCSYSLKRLKGAFAIPGRTEATVSGTAKLLAGNSESCPKMVRTISGEAILLDAATSEPFEAEL